MRYVCNNCGQEVDAYRENDSNELRLGLHCLNCGSYDVSPSSRKWVVIIVVVVFLVGLYLLF